MTLPKDFVDQARAFLADDPDPTTRAALEALISTGDANALAACFAVPLTFGTAGLRGEIGVGPARMNRAVVARATAGLCLHMLAAIPDAKQRGLCIGFDGRHMSREFAEEAASIAAGMGIRVHTFATPVSTPLLSFAVVDARAAGGVMVTASHNPAADNGYKAYWENGAQVIPPHDRAIEDAMVTVTSVLALPRLDASARKAAGLENALGEETEKRYFAGVAKVANLPSRTPAKPARDIAIAYTALHGVGERFVRVALRDAGFTNLHSVPEQAEPHPDFPTVAFPNPEEKGAMDLVTALAERVNAKLVLANDPDADRLAIAARAHDGKLVQLTGNEVGALLTDALLARVPAKSGLILSSIVSSPLIGVIAAAYGAHWEPTLTGFKWIANRAMVLQAERNLPMTVGLEEALGYSVGTLVRDKDGVSAALCVACIAADLDAQGSSILDALDTLVKKHGAYASGQRSVRAAGLDGPARMAAVMQRARQTPPSAIAGYAVSSVIDLANSSSTGTPSFDPTVLPSSDVVIWELGEHGRIALRPSGTEPKLKLYVDTCCRASAGEAPAATRARAQALLTQLADEVSSRLDM